LNIFNFLPEILETFFVKTLDSLGYTGKTPHVLNEGYGRKEGL
jgi:hypothetical protein